MKKIFEVFWRFLALGCVSFGGPAAHLGYFQKAFVEKLQWIDIASYGRLVALSQFLPGPGSSQVGFALGFRRAGVMGGFAAFLGFLLPSFILLYFVATTASQYQQHSWVIGIVHGLKLLAVVVVADATYGMSLIFCKEKMSVSIAVASAAVLMLASSLVAQILVLGGSALLGSIIGRAAQSKPAEQARFSWPPLVLFGLLFAGLPLIAPLSSELEIFSDFYESGSLVFGGGHVVLPLLQQTLGDAIATDRFLVGYASAQAVPGPMFALAAFLGVDLLPSMPLWGAIIATVGIFLPGILLVLSLQGAWEALAAKPRVAGAVWGINAAVVGLLFSALYQPIFVSAVDGPVDMAVVLLGFYALRVLQVPIVALVLALGCVGVVL